MQLIPYTAGSNSVEWVRKAATAINWLVSRSTKTVVNQRQIAAAATIALDDYLVAVDATSAAITVTLPPIEAGRVLVVKKVDASANVVTVDANAAEQIDGAATYSLTAQWQSVTLIGGSTQWRVA